jgi:hypothetical protein
VTVSWTFRTKEVFHQAGPSESPLVSGHLGFSVTAPAASGAVRVAPSVTTGVNRLGSMERVDQAGGVGAPTVTLEISDFSQVAVGATGIKTTTAVLAASSVTLALRPSSGGGTTKVSYVRDVTNRIVERRVNDVAVARYSFSSGDTPDAELDGANAVQRRWGWSCLYDNQDLLGHRSCR